jgi:hypothetical protein
MIEEDTKNVAVHVSVLYKALWMLITVSCWFYSLFLFDTLGDSVGFDKSYWVLWLMLLMPLILFTAYSLLFDQKSLRKAGLDFLLFWAQGESSAVSNHVNGVTNNDNSKKTVSLNDKDRTTKNVYNNPACGNDSRLNMSTVFVSNPLRGISDHLVDCDDSLHERSTDIELCVRPSSSNSAPAPAPAPAPVVPAMATVTVNTSSLNSTYQ